MDSSVITKTPTTTEKSVPQSTPSASLGASFATQAEVHNEALRIVNKRFDSKGEECLTENELDDVLKKFGRKVHRLDDAVLKAVQGGEASSQVLQHANDSVVEVVAKVNSFADRAADLETFVDKFRKETGPLEKSKRELLAGLTAIKNIRMLVRAVSDLHQLASDKNYSACAEMMDAVNALWGMFDGVKSHPKLHGLSSRLGECHAMLKAHIMADLKGRSGAVSPESLRQACVCVSALGPLVIDDVIQWWSDNFLRPYPGIRPQYMQDGEDWMVGPNDLKRASDWFSSALHEKAGIMSQSFPSSWSALSRAAGIFLERNLRELRLVIRDAQSAGSMTHERLVDMQYAAADLESRLRSMCNDESITPHLSAALSAMTGVSDIGLRSNSNAGLVSNDSSGNVDIPIITISIDDLNDDSEDEGEAAVPADRRSSMHSTSGFLKPQMLTGAAKVLDQRIIIPDAMKSSGMLVDNGWKEIQMACSNDQVNVSAYEILLLCTELNDMASEWQATPEDMECIDSLRAPLGITRRLLKQIRSNSTLLDGDDSHADILGLSEDDRIPAYSPLHLCQLLLCMKPRRFLTGINLEPFDEWKKRHTLLLLATIVSEISDQNDRRWRVKGHADMISSDLVDTAKDVVDEIVSRTADTTETWERVCERPHEDAIRRLVNIAFSVLSPKGWKWPKSIAHRLYETLVKGTFDHEIDGRPLSLPDQLPGLLQHFRALMGLSEMHEWTVVRCNLFQWATFGDAWFLQQTAASLMSAVLPADGMGGLYAKSIVQEAEHAMQDALCDSRAHFSMDPAGLLPAAQDVFVSCRRLRLGRDSMANAALEACAMCSARKLYGRLRADHAGGELAPLDIEAAASLLQQVADEVEFEAETFGSGWNSKQKDLLTIGVKEMMNLVHLDVSPILGTEALDRDTVLLWQAAVRVSEEAKKACGKKVKSSTDQFAAMFAPLVGQWIQGQQVKFDECLENALIGEEQRGWRPIDDRWKDGPSQALSSSAIDLFAMFSASVPALFDLGVPISKEEALSIAESVDLILMKYCNQMAKSCGQEDRLKPSEKEDSHLAIDDKLKSFLKKDGGLHRRASISIKKVFEHGESLIDKTIDKVKDLGEIGSQKSSSQNPATQLEIPPSLLEKPADLESQTLEVLCVRLNNLRFVSQQLEHLEQQVHQKWDVMLETFKDDDSDELSMQEADSASQLSNLADTDRSIQNIQQEDTDLGTLFLGSRIAAQDSWKNIFRYIGTKVVWYDLRDELVVRLYAPTVSMCRLIDLLEPDSPLDSMLSNLVWLVGEEMYKDMFIEVFRQLVAVLERIILDEAGMTVRTFSPDDAVLIKEDINALCDYFVQPDENDEPQGISMEVAREVTKRISQLNNIVLSQPSAELIQHYNDPSTHETHVHKVDTRQVIGKVLAKRPDKDARRFVQQMRGGLRMPL